MSAEKTSKKTSKDSWSLGSLNVQAGLATHSYRGYLTGSWHHFSPTLRAKNKNLYSIGDCVTHLDFFGVQEIDPGSLRSGFANQAHHLADHGDFEYYTYQANRMTGFSTTANALFSKLPLQEVEHITLPSRKSAISPRGILLCHSNLSGAESAKSKKSNIIIAVAHLSLNAADRRRQAEMIAQHIKKYPKIILMGDFNDTPDSLALEPLQEILGGHTTSPTYPRWNPTRNIDTIWWKGVDVLREECHQWGSTDHCGVEIEFSL